MLAGLIRDLRKGAKLHPLVWVDGLRAAIELARANRRLEQLDLAALAPSAIGETVAAQELDPDQRDMVSRVAFAVPRVASRLPFRSDCLIQATAAQNWLARKGIASEVVIGARNQGQEGFTAHAWLKVGDLVVTGGDICTYLPFSPVNAGQSRDG